MRELFFITSNHGKVHEATEKLRPLGYAVIQKDLGYPELQADSLEEVASWGASYIQERFNKPFILEDAGIFIDVLQGFPGVYSKYVFYTIGLDGVLHLLKGSSNRKARFRSVFAYSEPGRKPILAIGECAGTITMKKQGTHGFGYDPLFIPNGARKTFGEMSVEEKNYFSHRSKALEQLHFILQENL